MGDMRFAGEHPSLLGRMKRTREKSLEVPDNFGFARVDCAAMID